MPQYIYRIKAQPNGYNVGEPVEEQRFELYTDDLLEVWKYAYVHYGRGGELSQVLPTLDELADIAAAQKDAAAAEWDGRTAC